MATKIKASAPDYSLYELTANPVNDNDDFALEVEGMFLRPGAPSWTAAKTKRVALYIFAAVCVIGGVALIGLSVTGVIPAPLGYLAIPLFLLAITSVCVASQILDYEDPVELQALKDEAPNLTYRQLVSKHGLENIFTHDILASFDLETKFRTHIAGMTFKAFNWEFTIEDLELLQFHGILIDSDLAVLRSLKIRLEEGRVDLSAIQLTIDEKYPNRTNRELHRIRCDEGNAKAKKDREIQRVVADWDSRIQAATPNLRANLERQKTNAVTTVTSRAETELNSTLQRLQSQREALSTNHIAIQQQQNYDQEIESVRRENSTATAAIEAAFANWLHPNATI